MSKQESVNSFLDKMRDAVKNHKFNVKGYLSDEANLKQELQNFKFPQTWDIFSTKLSGHNGSLKIKLMSAFMDKYHIVNRGELTPKYIALSDTIHHITRSKHHVT